jgi:hypothetical protein
MNSNRRTIWDEVGAIFALAAFVSIPVIVMAGVAAPRIHLTPKLVKGNSFRYRIESNTSTVGSTKTPIINPEGPTKVTESKEMIVRLDVLEAGFTASGATAGTRLRVTYEKASATAESDGFNPQASALSDQFGKLEGRSIEFTIDQDGKISDVAGFQDFVSSFPTEQSIATWMEGIVSGSTLPKEGIIAGQTWTTEKPIDGIPLGGLAWRAASSYLRDEDCGPSDDYSAESAVLNSANLAGKEPAATQDNCAVILTRSELVRHGSAHGDATPENFLHHGMRTAGTWKGTSETLASISLTTGMLVTSTQSISQQMDYTITSTASGSAVKYSGHTENTQQITLLRNAPPDQPAK